LLGPESGLGFDQRVKIERRSVDAVEIASGFPLDSGKTVVLDRVKAFTPTNATFRDQRYPELQRGGNAHCDLLKGMVDYLKRVGVIH
jgi:hypothetical protein